MLKYIIKRFINLIPVVFIISVVLFGLLHIMPGDPEDFMIQCGAMKPEACEIAKQAYRDRNGLDEPIYVQYFLWASNVLQGDLGDSGIYNIPVIEAVGPFIKNSIILNSFVLIVSFLVAIPIGIVSAVKRYSLFDNFWQVFSLLGISMPSFFFGILLIYLFSMTLGWLPLSGMQTIGYEFPTVFGEYWDVFKHMMLPATVLIIGSLAGTIRYVRSAMLDVIRQDFIRTARSKGLSERVVIYSHAFRNALIPVVTLIAFSIPGLFSGAVITETIFAWPGIGRVLLVALQQQDYALVLAMNMFYAMLALMANLIMDISYALVDPRVKLS
jgi:peptide/nickel transport system permease protein